MKRIAKVAAVSAAGLGLILGSSPAQAAAHAGVVAFVGSIVVYPSLDWCHGTLRDSYWALTTEGGLPNVGVGVTSEGPSAGIAAINVLGQVHLGLFNMCETGAFAGPSSGSDGAGTISIAGTSVEVVDVGWPQSAATVTPFIGDTLVRGSATQKGGVLMGVARVFPFPGSGVFTVVGVGAATYTV